MLTDMAYFLAWDQRPAAVFRTAVQRADGFVIIVGFRYGSHVRERPEVSYTDLEFEVAGQIGIPWLVFLLDDDRRRPGPNVHRRRRRLRLEHVCHVGLADVRVGCVDRLGSCEWWAWSRRFWEPAA